MREVELQFDASTTVALTADLCPVTSATLTLFAPNGSVVSAPTVTLPTISTTTATGTTEQALVLASVTGITAGTLLRVTSDSVTYGCEVASVDATSKTVTLLTALALAPDDGSDVYGVTLTASVPAPGATAIGSNYRLSWVYSDGTTSKSASQPASVVRWQWTACCSKEDVADVLSEMSQTRPAAWCQAVADRVDTTIQGELLATGKRPQLYLSSSVFTDAARAAIRYELSKSGIALGAGQIYEAQRELRFAADDKLVKVITGLQGITDTDNNGKIEGKETEIRGYTVQVTR